MKCPISILVFVLWLAIASSYGQNIWVSHHHPYHDKCQEIIDLADSNERLASTFLSNSDWSVYKRIRKSKKANLQAYSQYVAAHDMTCVEDYELIYAQVRTLNEARKHRKAMRLLKTIIESGRLDADFFEYYFTTVNRHSSLEDLRRNRRIVYGCDSGVDINLLTISGILSGAKILFDREEHALLLEYYRHQSVMINYSRDQRFNDTNTSICQLLIKALKLSYTIDEIRAAFEEANVVENQIEAPTLGGDSLYHPSFVIKIFDIPLAIYERDEKKVHKFYRSSEDQYLIDFDADPKTYKALTIFSHQLDQLEQQIR